MELGRSLVRFAASASSQPAWVLDDVDQDDAHPLRRELEAALASVTEDELEELVTSPKGAHWYSMPLDARSERRARLDLVKQRATQLAYELRRDALCQGADDPRPAPYGLPALSGVEPDDHRLVPASEFVNARESLRRGGYVFHLPPTLPAANSSYWLTQQLLRRPAEEGLRIRLDPFIACPLNEYQPGMYKMVTYGRPLDWDRLSSLREEEHGEWMPDRPTAAGGMDCTQYCWSPRDDGIHFKCEELPANADMRPGRYAHAIYDPSSGRFTHADGAVRFYSAQQLSQRRELHVRNAGKTGTRIKLFEFSSPLDRDGWCDVIAAFFVWNDDVRGYFQQDAGGA